MAEREYSATAQNGKFRSMKAMLLAAGLGSRLKPLTDRLPKPLLRAGAATLIEHHLNRLNAAGFDEVVINLHYLGHLIEEEIGDGLDRGMRISYSREPKLLDTGGGVKAALDFLEEKPFVVISSDVYIEMDYRTLPLELPQNSLGCLVMVPNPAHHDEGDFCLREGILINGDNKMTYSGIAVLSPQLLRSIESEVFALRRVFELAISAGQLHGVAFHGYWCDVGTFQRYEGLKKHLSSPYPDE